MNQLLVTLLIVVGLINLTLGIIILLGAKRTARTRLFFLFVLSVMAWSFGIAFFYATNNPYEAIIYAKSYYIAAALIGFSLATFALAYVNGTISKKVLLFLALPTLIICVMSAHPNGLIEGVYLGDVRGVQLNANLYIFYSLYFLAYMYIALALTAYSYLKRTQIYSRDATALRYIFLALILGGTVGIYFNLILPFFNNYQLIWVGPLGSIVMVWFIFSAIIRYGLFDVRLAIARTIGYILSFIVLGFAYGIVVTISPSVLANFQVNSSQQYFANLIVLIFLAVTFQPLKQIFDVATDKIFLKKRYDLKETLDAIGKVAIKSLDKSTILNSTLRILDQTLRLTIIKGILIQQDDVQHANKTTDEYKELIAIADGIKEKIVVVDLMPNKAQAIFEAAGIAAFARLETASGKLGYIFLGRKENGGKYNAQDIELLTITAYELAIAIENSSRFSEIRDFSETLQQKIATATNELKQTNKKLHEIDKSKDEFISMASHQLRTPLTTVKGYISMLLDGDVGKVTPKQREVLEEAFSSAQRMVFLISDFLNVSRLQTGKFELELRPVDLAELVEQEVRQVKDTAKARKMTLEYIKSTEDVYVTLDENKMRQVIMNFIDNAIYYSKPGDAIQISLARHSDRISFRVKDHGIGVPAQERHNLFTKFYRASNAKKQRPDGTGIGLFMARKVITAHGGSIIFETVEGKGSTFGFRLPLKDKSN